MNVAHRVTSWPSFPGTVSVLALQVQCSRKPQVKWAGWSQQVELGWEGSGPQSRLRSEAQHKIKPAAKRIICRPDMLDTQMKWIGDSDVRTIGSDSAEERSGCGSLCGTLRSLHCAVIMADLSSSKFSQSLLWGLKAYSSVWKCTVNTVKLKTPFGCINWHVYDSYPERSKYYNSVLGLQ